ncbi:hypothetical protein ACTFIY_001429 [Dictyostelium cf. discoideum]
MFENIKSLIFSAVSLLFSFLYYHSNSIISLFTQNLGEAVLETIDEVIHKPQTSLQQESLKLHANHYKTIEKLAAAIGIDPYTSQHDLKLILAKKKIPFFSDYCKKAMEHGKRQEPIARELYFNNLETSIIEKGIFPLPGDKRIGCSPDGVIYTTVPGKDGVLQREGVIEIKCPLSATNFSGLKNGRKPDALANAQKIPLDYIPQIFANMACTGAKWCDYICWVPGEVYFCRRVFFDLNVWKFIYSLAKSFIDTPLNGIPLKNEKTLIINTLLLQKLKVLNPNLNILVRTKS